MPSLAFTLSLMALLFAPGPTNALLALAGAEAGTRRTLRLLPVVLLAYGLAVLPLASLGAGLMQQGPTIRMAVTLAAAAWVGWLALALWLSPANRQAGCGRDHGIKLFITTLLNPKALIIGLALIPAEPSRTAALALFFAVLAAAAAAWVTLGGLLHRRRNATDVPLLRKVCAGWLGALAVWLGTAALAT